ncbi:MAG: SDR family oxidoreductase [Gammaproteobacteria bacterium]|nr:SDR family oxidoreductase [Gammaproteobacteria bacterium]
MNKRWANSFGLRLLVMAGLMTSALAQHTLTGELPKPVASSPAVVLVVGATGRTGRQILDQLRRDPRFAIRPMARDVVTAGRESGADFGWIEGDVTRPETLGPALAGVSFVLCAVGATERSGPNSPEFVDYGGVKNLADAARAAGVRQVVLESSMGAGSGGGLLGMFLNLLSGDALKWKAKGEAHLRASGVPYTIVRPGGLADEPAGQTGLALKQGDEGSGRIARADVAAVMIAALDNPDAVGKTFEVFNDEDSPVNAWRGGFSALKPDPH